VPSKFLQVQGQQEGAEQHGADGELHHEAAAEGAVGESLNAQQRPGDAQFDACVRRGRRISFSARSRRGDYTES
jgi:hypothetical protein